MIQSSPFLHRGGRQELRTASQARRDRAEADKVAAACTLERLRYRWWQRQGTLGSFMQRLGDWGREYFPFIGRGGWNGLGGSR